MTTTVFTVAPSLASDADFRAWGSAVSNGFATVGLAKSSDSGQVNWATVTKPASANTWPGFEIWRFNDPLQATHPIVFKIDYGAGGSATNPSVRITIGKASDGAGAITGTILSTVALSPTTSSAIGSNWYLTSGDKSMIGFVAAVGTYNSASQSLHFVIERSRAVDGSPTSTGLFFAAQPNVTFRTYNYATIANITNSRFAAAIPGTLGQSAALGSGGRSPLFPGLVTDGVGNFWQPRSALVGMLADIGSFNAITVDGFGTYMPMGAGASTWDAYGNVNAIAALLWQ